MNETYTITVIEDPQVPLAAVPGGGIPVEQTLFIILLLCVMAGCAVFFLHRYLEECRALRTRIAELKNDIIVTMPSYKEHPAERMEGHFSKKKLSDTVQALELEKVQASINRIQSN